MPRKQLTALFLCNLTGLTVGIALIGLLPVYATRLGADSALTGYYMALAFLAFSVGGVASGWLSDRFQRRKVFLVVGWTIAAPLTWLMSQATGIGQLAVLTTVVWFAGSGVWRSVSGGIVR
jgi:MFS family permease